MKAKKTNSQENGNKSARMSLIIGVISFLGVVLTAYFSYLTTRTQIELPVQFTQTAFAESSRVTPSLAVAITTTPNINTPKIVFGPAQGKLNHVENDISADRTSLWLRNFIAQVTFINPYDVAENAWTYGIGFRDTGKNQEYRLRIYSESTWDLYLKGGVNGIHDRTIIKGKLGNLDTSANGSNTIRLIVQDETADFYLNDIHISSLDLSAKNELGDIFVATGFIKGSSVPGKFTLYQEFTVWELR